MIKRFLVLSVLVIFLFSFSEGVNESVQPLIQTNDTIDFFIPEGWPVPEYDFEKNPLTKNGIALGRKLFYETMLSRDSSISCASCHLSFTNFTHIDHKVSHGINDRIGTRNSLSIMNVAWQKTFMWDGGISHLDMQPLGPLSSPDEMDITLKTVVKRLQESEKYKLLFNEAFGDSSNISGYYFLRALSQFMLTFNTYNSKYDQVMRKEEGVAFSASESKGLITFRNNCASCHQEPLFTNGSFENNGLPLDEKFKDGGRIKITGNPSDSLKFRVPSLRNIEVSYPYMHDGRFKNLQTVLFHYSNGISDSETLAEGLKGGIQLSEDEKRNLVAFLKTLTDVQFIRNKEFTYPRD